MSRCGERIDVVYGGEAGHFRMIEPPPAFQETLQLRIIHTFDKNSNQKSIRERRQGFVNRQIVGRPDAHSKRACNIGVTAAEHSFIQNAQKCIEDRGRAMKDLV